jgi:hypothetical protein
VQPCTLCGWDIDFFSSSESRILRAGISKKPEFFGTFSVLVISMELGVLTYLVSPS